MPSNPETSHAPERGQLPVWMRKSTLWVVLALSAGMFALIAYYLLPLWWARLVSAWVASTGVWVTGLTLGFVPVALGLGSVIWAAKIAPRTDDEEAGGKGAHYLRLTLSVIAGIALVLTVLTILIAAGVSEPLREARQFWLDHAPGVLTATLVGGLIGIIVILGEYTLSLRFKNRQSVNSIEGAVEETEKEPPTPAPGTDEPPVNG